MIHLFEGNDQTLDHVSRKKQKKREKLIDNLTKQLEGSR